MGLHLLVEDSQLGVAYGEYVLRKLFKLQAIDMVFDIGANSGQYGFCLRKQIGYRGALRSYEPIPELAGELRSATKADGNWTICQCALDEFGGEVDLNVMVGDQFSSLLRPSEPYRGRFFGQNAVKNVIKVDAVTLATAVAEAPAFSNGLLKLDTQGTELAIMRGGVEVLPRFVAIQMELGFHALYEGAGTFVSALDALDSWGYRLCALFPNNEGHFPHLIETDALFMRKDAIPDLK